MAWIPWTDDCQDSWRLRDWVWLGMMVRDRSIIDSFPLAAECPGSWSMCFLNFFYERCFPSTVYLCHVPRGRFGVTGTSKVSGSLWKCRSLRGEPVGRCHMTQTDCGRKTWFVGKNEKANGSGPWALSGHHAKPCPVLQPSGISTIAGCVPSRFYNNFTFGYQNELYVSILHVWICPDEGL